MAQLGDLTDQRQVYLAIRDEIEKACGLERRKRGFNLSGRGHEPRITLNRRMAAILRSCDIPRVTISGYGANNHYPARVFERAMEALTTRLGWCPFARSSDGVLCFVERAGSVAKEPKP